MASDYAAEMAAKADKRMEQALATSSVDTDEYIDQTPAEALSKQDINRMAWRSCLLQASFNYERMQAGGWLYTLIPGLRKIHKNETDFRNSMKMHMELVNLHPFLVTFLSGLILAMEQGKEKISTIRSIKVALMGPMGGIGDALLWLTVLPIAAGFGASLSLQGSIFGPIMFLVLLNITNFGLRFWLAHYGYKTGVGAIAALKANTQKISHAANTVGMFVIGALIASYVRVDVPLVLKSGVAEVAVQTEVLDKLMPNLLPLLFTFMVYHFMKKGMSPVKMIGVTVLIGVGGSLLGVL